MASHPSHVHFLRHYLHGDPHAGYKCLKEMHTGGITARVTRLSLKGKAGGRPASPPHADVLAIAPAAFHSVVKHHTEVARQKRKQPDEHPEEIIKATRPTRRAHVQYDAAVVVAAVAAKGTQQRDIATSDKGDWKRVTTTWSPRFDNVQVDLQMPLGGGAFGSVYVARVLPKGTAPTKLVYKTIKEVADVQEDTMYMRALKLFDSNETPAQYSCKATREFLTKQRVANSLFPASERGFPLPVILATGNDPGDEMSSFKGMLMERYDCDLVKWSDEVGGPTTAKYTPLLARDLMLALWYIHDKRYIHGDVRRANVCVRKTPRGPQFVLVDLGLALHFSKQPPFVLPDPSKGDEVLSWDAVVEEYSLERLMNLSEGPHSDLESLTWLLVRVASNKPLPWYGTQKQVPSTTLLKLRDKYSGGRIAATHLEHGMPPAKATTAANNIMHQAFPGSSSDAFPWLTQLLSTMLQTPHNVQSIDFRSMLAALPIAGL